MSLSPITLFCLAFVVGALGGLWHVVQGEDQRLRRYIDGILGGALVGLSLSLLLYEKVGLSEFGQCTLLGLSLVLSMAGKVGFQRLLMAAARLYLGEDQQHRSAPWRPPTPPRLTDETREDTTGKDAGNEKATWP